MSSFESVLRLNERVSHPVVVHGLVVTEGKGSDSLSSDVTESRHSSENGPLGESELSVLEVVKHTGVHSASSTGSSGGHTKLNHKGDHTSLSLKELGLVHEESIGLVDDLIGSIVGGVRVLESTVVVGVDDSEVVVVSWHFC